MPAHRARHRLARLLPALALGLLAFGFLGALGARPASAQCVNGAACNDFSACTINDTCVGNVCVGTAITCAEDGDVCTTAACNPTLGCQQIANTASCDDGDPCTVGDACSAFVCRSGAPKNCNDGNACTTDQCNVATGACFSTNNTASCSDGNACTTGDFCSGGSCQPGPTPLVCNDGKTCTTDSCNPGSGCAFTNVANGTGCNDNSLCTTSDRCTNGLCLGTTVTCADDTNVCTTAACNPALGCQQVPNTAACDDANPCTVGDLCSGGACLGGGPKNCSDGNVCTTDQCNLANGACFWTNNSVSCNDGNVCTTADFCSGGSCQPGPTPLVCNDGQTCTNDACNPASGCTFTNAANGTGCNDNSLCTTSDRCTNGVCGGTSVTCSDDTNVCTTAACSPTLGCQQVPNTAACDDTNPCTVGDVCSGGACLGGGPKNCSDGNDCTTDLCERDGSCTHANNTSSCNDGNACTQNDVCTGGVCQSGVNLTCNPGNGPCQVGSCDAVLGCVLANALPGTGCNDGNACTTADACSNGACIGSAIPGCVPAPVPTLSFWSRVGLVVALAFTALMASAHWERRRSAS